MRRTRLTETQPDQDSNRLICSAAHHIYTTAKFRALCFAVYDRALALSKHGKGVFYAAAAQMAQYFRVDEQSVWRAYKELVRRGWFVIEDRRSHRPTVYRVLTHPQWKEAHPGQCVSPVNGQPSLSTGETRLTSEIVTKEPQPCQPVSPSRNKGRSRIQLDSPDMELAVALSNLSNGEVMFRTQDREGLAVLLEHFAHKEITAVFQGWLDEKDLSNPLRREWAAKDFIEAAPVLLKAARERARAREQYAALRAATLARYQAEGEAILTRLKEKEQEEDQEIVLPA